MQKFEYREPRFAADLPARFILEHQILAGRCLEISKQGVTLKLECPVQPGTSGTISLTHQSRTFEVRAKVAHADGHHGGFEFVYAGETERAAIAHLVAALATPVKHLGPVLVQPPNGDQS